MRKLNLPASLEALERHVGLPPSLLHKAEEVRLENGPDTIEASLEDVEMLADRDAAILEEVSGFQHEALPLLTWLLIGLGYSG